MQSKEIKVLFQNEFWPIVENWICNAFRQIHYGNTGCCVFKGGGVQNGKDFCLKIKTQKKLGIQFWELGIILENKVI